ncbi:MAG: hypothetical protein KME48_19330 [Candidatus Thiodiazotropha sp. (ex Ctena orbiculata)]|nr:hypothetical protein [Candidatus Thiodiazotropha taylori]MBT3037041.1 hypothetical protein [Candidatus Thiodiazotropha taylori]
MRIPSIAGCALVASVFAANAAKQVDNTFKCYEVAAKKPFSALLVEYRKESSNIKTKTRIYFGSKGIRTERLTEYSDKPYLVVIKNNSSDKMWLVNPIKQYFAEVPRGNSNKTGGVNERRQKQVLGVLSSKPCYGMRSEKQSARRIGETELSVWHCFDNDNKQYLQHYSTLLGVVIRQESQDGQVSELQEISFIDESVNYFLPSSEMQQISIEELITGRLVLQDFVE